MLRLIRDREGSSPCPEGSVVCIGAFDGIHRGHQALLAEAGRRANDLDLPLAVLTFEPLPRAFFAGGQILRLTTPRERMERLCEAGVALLWQLRFNAALAATAAEEFIEQLLVPRLRPRWLLVGQDFRFGRGRVGDRELLVRLGRRHGFEVASLDLIADGGERVSSSAIRAALSRGDLADAARLLGRPFSMSGRVQRGQQLGRTLGYPTANLRLGRRLPPVQGIFAVSARIEGAPGRPGVASLGTRPTVAGIEPWLEVHLFDFEGDLYGRRLEVDFHHRLRDELNFPDLDTLVAQMHLDAAQARRLLAQTEERSP